MTASTAPVATDIVPAVVDPGGTPANRKITFGNIITKAHGLSDGIAEVASSVLTVSSVTGTGAVARATNAVLVTPTLGVAGATSLAVTNADGVTVNSVIVPQEIEVSCHVGAAALMVDQSFFVANQAYQVTKVRFVHSAAETTAATLLVQVVKDTATDAPGAGTDLLTNNTNAGFDCKATANTVQVGTLTGTAASLQLAAGNRLSLDFSAAATELAGVTITISLKRI